MKRTAEVQRDAKIGEAEAKKDSGIKVIAHWTCQSLTCMLVIKSMGVGAEALTNQMTPNNVWEMIG